jgi:hypothetical protein
MDPVVGKRSLTLEQMEPKARDAMREALAGCRPISKEDQSKLTLGKALSEQAGVFELYVAGERPQDARVIGRATVDRDTGEVRTEVFLEKLS